jgi:thiol-disulfide isomerase/thioredoxin
MSTGVKVIMFTSPSCVPCNSVKPTIAELQDDYSEFEWDSVNVMKDPAEIGPKLHVRLVPTMVVLKPDGTEFGRHEGSALIGYFYLLKRAKALLTQQQPPQ